VLHLPHPGHGLLGAVEHPAGVMVCVTSSSVWCAWRHTSCVLQLPCMHVCCWEACMELVACKLIHPECDLPVTYGSEYSKGNDAHSTSVRSVRAAWLLCAEISAAGSEQRLLAYHPQPLVPDPACTQHSDEAHVILCLTIAAVLLASGRTASVARRASPRPWWQLVQHGTPPRQRAYWHRARTAMALGQTA
jgi:hypothetical protein